MDGNKKGLAEIAYGDLTPWLLLTGSPQMLSAILVLAFQVEEAKQNTWMGRVRIALLREGESPFRPGKGKEEERPGSLGRLFLYHLELGGGETIHHHLACLTCELRTGALKPSGEQSQTVPNLACLNFMLNAK
jgi:hypothetical protein